MAAAHNGPQAAGCRASCRTFKSPYRRARKPGAGLTYAGAARAFKEMGLRGKIPRPETPCGEPRGAHRPPEEGKGEPEASGRGAPGIAFEDEGRAQALKNGHAMASLKGVQPARGPSAGRARPALFVAAGE